MNDPEDGLSGEWMRPRNMSSHKHVDLCWCLAAAFGLALVTPGISRAFFEDLYVSGFVSQGYYKTSEYDYGIDNSQDGTAEFNEAALSVYSQPTEKLHIGVQLLSRDMGDIGNNSVRLDWAYGDYRWRDWLGVRAGKVKLQMGLYSIGWDVDMLRTPIFLPGSVYSESWRDFTLAHEGISFYGNSGAGSWGDLDYEVFAGALNVPDVSNSYWKKAFSSDIQFELEYVNPIFADSLRYEFIRAEELSINFPWIMGGALVWNTPLNGLRFASMVNVGEYDMTFHSLIYQDTIDPDTGELQDRSMIDLRAAWKDRYYMNVFSMEYAWKQFIASAELLNFKDTGGVSQGWYAMLTWEPASLYSFSTYVSEHVQDIDDREGKRYVELGLPDYAGWQREVALSGRLNLTQNWLIKAEVHGYDGVGQVLYRDIGDETNRYWTMFALKTTFHF